MSSIVSRPTNLVTITDDEPTSAPDTESKGVSFSPMERRVKNFDPSKPPSSISKGEEWYAKVDAFMNDPVRKDLEEQVKLLKSALQEQVTNQKKLQDYTSSISGPQNMESIAEKVGQIEEYVTKASSDIRGFYIGVLVVILLVTLLIGAIVFLFYKMGYFSGIKFTDGTAKTRKRSTILKTFSGGDETSARAVLSDIEEENEENDKHNSPKVNSEPDEQVDIEKDVAGNSTDSDKQN